MSAAPDGTSRPSGSVPLGQILVRRGLLSEEQLQAALEEGQRTGEQVGSAIVRLGLLPASTIAQALATQVGRTLKTEYGFAVGFAGDTPAAGGNPTHSPSPLPPAPAEPGAVLPLLRTGENVAPKATAPPAGTAAHTPALSPQLPAPALTASAGPAIRQAAPDREVQRLQAEVADLASKLDAARSEVEAGMSERATFDDALRSAAARIESLEAARAAGAAEVATLERQLARGASAAEAVEQVTTSWDAERRALEEALAAERGLVATVKAERQALSGERDELLARVAELASAEEAAAALTRELESVRDESSARVTGLQAQLEEAAAAASAAASDLQASSAEVCELKLELASALAPTREQEISSHLLFVAASDSYQLIQREGPPPLPGTEVELSINGSERSRHIVTKVAVAPLPGKPVPCAYLITS